METAEKINIEETKAEINNLRDALAIDPTEEGKKSFQDIINDLEKQLADAGEEQIVEQVQPLAPIEDEPIVKQSKKLNLFDNDFYKNHPEKVLGDTVMEKNMFGKEIEIVKGDFSNLQKVDLNYSFIPAENTAETVIKNKKPTKNNASIDKIIDSAEKDIANKTVSKKKRKVEVEPQLTVELSNFEQTFYSKDKDNIALNGDISLEELRVFVWHKEMIGQPLNQKWYDLAEITAKYQVETFGEDAWIIEKIKDGLLYYYNGNLLPAYLYLAENIYEKYIRLVKQEGVVNAGKDAKHIIDTYGQDVYDKQVEALNSVYKNLYDQRLVIGAEGEVNTLKLIAYSDFCKNFMVSTLIDEVPFKICAVSAPKSTHYGQPDFFKECYVSKWKDQRKDFPELSLTDAFCYWLVKDQENIVFKKGVSYADIIRIYVQQKQRSSTPKVKTTGNYVADEAAQKTAEALAKAEWERRKEKCRSEGERLFNIFLNEQIKLADKVRIELTWNMAYNNYVPINYNKIPVAFTIAKDFGIKQEKRDAVAFLFNQGSGCLAYDVGVGKTPAAIFAIRQYLDSGYCKRPMIIVPNQTYRQWISEIKKIMPDIKINDLYNLAASYQEELWDENNKVSPVREKSITVLTYEGLEKLGFNEVTEKELFNELYDILIQGELEEQNEKKKEKKIAAFEQRLLKLIGRGLAGSMVNIEDMGTDFICFDEAHAMKKVFTSVKGKVEETDDGKKRGRTPYKISSGTASSTGLKGFMMAQYIQRNNHGRNILMLTATPFTNSPLEIFSMLSLVAYKQLQQTDLNNISSFFDNYIEMSSQLVVTANLKAQFKQVVTGFRNIASLQSLIFKYFDYKDENNIPELKLIRPTKWVLPLLTKVVDGIEVKLNENEKIETYIPLTPLQESLMKDIIAYSEGNINIKELAKNAVDVDLSEDVSEDELVDTEAFDLSEEEMDEKEKAGVRMIKSIMFSQNLALSPYLYEFSGLRKPTYLEYINTSPKLQFVMECIKSVKKYHEDNGEPVSGQIIYMNRGITYFPLIKKYLVEVVGYKPHEVGMINSKMAGGKTAKEDIKNLFLGLRYNESLKAFEEISDDERIKVLIGSATIKEGMNLQKKTTLLYNCFIDWNPTDLLQLYGRLHRQGNEFKNVRCVNPLMINSSDIFLFQKISEKTTRINQIWKTGNKRNVLKLEELNPDELKFALIRDPHVIARYQLQDESAKIEDEIAGETMLLKKFQNIVEQLKNLNENREDVDKLIKEYRPKKYKDSLTDEQRIKIVTELLRNQTDEKGLKMVQEWERRDYYRRGEEVSEFDPAKEPTDFDEFKLAYRTVSRETKNWFEPNGKDINRSPKYIKQQESIIADLEKKSKAIMSDENIERMVEEIKEIKEKEKINIKNLPDIVRDFEKLNYLLSIKIDKKKIAEAMAEEFNCIVLDDKKEIRIDTEAIDQLEECINNLPSTKDLNSINGEYTEERKKLHQRIYEKYQSKKKCYDNPMPIAILTGGSPASGKSTFLYSYSPYLDSDKIYKLDADEVRAELPEYKGWNSQALHEETRDLMRNYLLSDENIGQPCKFDLIYDGTMNNTKNYLPLIGILKRYGYKVFIVYMNNITYELAIQRSLERFKNSKDHRYVPREVIADFFNKGKEALDELKTKVDGYIVVDGSTRDYKVIESGGMPIPQDRKYGELLMGGTKAVEILRAKDKETADTKAKQEKELATAKEKKEKIEADTRLKDQKMLKQAKEKKEEIEVQSRNQEKKIKKAVKQKKDEIRAVEQSKAESTKMVAEKVDKLESYKTKINALKVSLKYTKDKAKKAKIEKLIKATEISMKYAAKNVDKMCAGGKFAYGGSIDLGGGYEYKEGYDYTGEYGKKYFVLYDRASNPIGEFYDKKEMKGYAEQHPIMADGGGINEFKKGDKVSWLGEDNLTSVGNVTDVASTKKGQFVWIDEVEFAPEELHLLTKI